MRLSLDLLGYTLSRKVDLHIHRRVKQASSRKPHRGTPSLEEEFARPVLVTTGSIERRGAAVRAESSMSGRVVVLDADSLGSLIDAGGLVVDALYICGGLAPEAWFDAGQSPKPDMMVAPSASADDLLNLVQEIFDLFDRWESCLMRVLLEGGGFQAMLEATDSVMFHPLALQDNDFHLVAFSNMAREQKILEYFANGGSLDPSVVSNMIQGGAYARIVNNRGPYAFDLREVRGIALNLYHHERFEGFLLINVPEMDDALAAYYGDVLTVLGGYVGRLLSDRGRFDSHWLISNELRKLFDDGLSGKPLDPISWSKALIDSGWVTDADIRILCVGIGKTAHGAIGYLEKTINRRWPGAVAVPQGRNLAVLANGEELARHLEDPFESGLDTVFQDLKVKVGISRKLMGCGTLSIAFREAELAMSLAPVWSDGRGYRRLEDVALEAVLSKALETLPARSLCDEALLQLENIDATSQTEYVDTIKAYLDCKLNAAAAARALGIQRSTFFYRLGRIRELTGLDVEKTESPRLVHIALSYSLLGLAPETSMNAGK